MLYIHIYIYIYVDVLYYCRILYCCVFWAKLNFGGYRLRLRLNFWSALLFSEIAAMLRQWALLCLSVVDTSSHGQRQHRKRQKMLEKKLPSPRSSHSAKVSRRRKNSNIFHLRLFHTIYVRACLRTMIHSAWQVRQSYSLSIHTGPHLQSSDGNPKVRYFLGQKSACNERAVQFNYAKLCFTVLPLRSCLYLIQRW